MMETFIHVDKENGALRLLPSKANIRTSAQFSKGLRPSNTKSFNVTKAQAIRKVLGNINVQVPAKTPAPKKVHVRKQENLVKRSEKYPTIETFIPYDPLEYERFDVPEEHKLSDRCLAGVPLFVTMVEIFDLSMHPVLSPIENESIHYDSYEAFTPEFEDLTVDLPLMCDF